ncbi:MAG: T9SS type A sorting domain-containing protein [Crocinitomicaceae bacterium]|nr:T9SS type A sorting domain-containing protein [Crocinitomicaceae bacterium]MBK8924872.1 T9SS type A sorting domain-containing protein [Crocinitomicaceae bacterium]
MKTTLTILLTAATGLLIQAQTASIYDIQFSHLSSGDSHLTGNIVTTRGIVTGVFTSGAEGTFFIQDGTGPWRGIYILDNTFDVTVGDSVEVTGKLKEYYSNTSIDSLTTMNIISSGNPLPSPVVVSTDSASMECYESVLVRVDHATCTNPDQGFGQFLVNDGSGNCVIDDGIYLYTPSANYIYTITGVRYFLFGESKICPRSSFDFITEGALEIDEEEVTIEIFPNPASEMLNVQIAEDASFKLINLAGEVILNGKGNTQLNVADYAPGIYFITIQNQGVITTEKIVIR